MHHNNSWILRCTLLTGALLTTLSGCGMRPGLRRVGDGPRNVVRLEKALRERIKTTDSLAKVSVSLVDLETGFRLGINDDVPMPTTASVRIPVLIEVYRQAEQGKLRIDDPIPIRNQFTRPDGSTYSVLRTEERDTTLFRMVGGSLPVRELLRAMITRSSRLATLLLIDKVTPQAIAQTLQQLDAEEMRVVNTSSLPREPTITSSAVARALEAIARCRIHTRDSCEAMLQLLATNESRELIPAGLADVTHVAHTTEREGEIHQDAAVVFPGEQKPYVLVVLIQSSRDKTIPAGIAASLSRIVWENLTESSTAVLPRR
jgi:beta-lactamase class A